MPPKSAKKGGNASDKSKAGEEKREEPLQALILADSFETKFEPFTLERPRCLLPLANTPLIEYTLEFLANAGVEEVFVYCGNHTDQVEEYLRGSKWTRRTSPLALEVVRSQAHSIGDAMRDMDQKQLLVGDFVCVYGDVVSNLSLEPALAAHRARRERNKNAIMTMVLREAGSSHRTQSQTERPVFLIDPAGERCLHYEQIRPGQQQHPRFNIDGEILAEHPELEVRADLIDCGIDICTPAVLSQWSDNFDWQMPRRGFLHGTLKDFELNGYSIHTHVIADDYAARVKGLRSYDAVSRDIVARWTYPLCPDSNLLPDQSYQLIKSKLYREDGVVLARSARVERGSVLGKNTTVGDGSVITGSIIGRRCVIGRRVRIEGAYIWDDAWIGDDTVIERAVVANEASVGRNCKLQPGALVSYGVGIADGITVAGKARITRYKRKRGYDQEEPVRGETDTKVVGQGGHGFDLEPDEDEEEEPEGLLGRVTNDDDDDISDDASISTLNSEEADSEEDEVAGHYRSSRADSFGSVGSVGSEESVEARHNAADFHHEAASSVFDSLTKGEGADNIQLELKALTLSSNADGKQVRRAVAVALMKRVANLVEAGATPQKAVAQTLTPNKLLIERAVLDRDREVKEEQVEFLLFMQTDLVHRAQGEKILLFACNALAQAGVVEPEGLEQWLEDERSSATEELVRVRKETEEIIGGEDESSEEEDDEDDDDDE